MMERLTVSFAGEDEHEGRDPYIRIDIANEVSRKSLDRLRDVCVGVCEQFGLSANNTAFVTQQTGEKTISQIFIGFYNLVDDGKKGEKTVGVVAQRIAQQIRKDLQ